LTVPTEARHNQFVAFSKGSFNIVDRDPPTAAGRIGGKSKSAAKVTAAKNNGKLGGRPAAERTLLERILNRKLTAEEHASFCDEALYYVLMVEQEYITKFFQTHWTGIPQVPWRSAKPQKVRQAIKHVIAVSKIYYWKPRVKPVKDYVVIRVPKSDFERQVWEQRHPNMPFVMTRPKKVYIKDLPNFTYLENVFARHPNLTEKEIIDSGGSRWTREHAVAFLKYLIAKNKSQS
jgi:hypothetical protein